MRPGDIVEVTWEDHVFNFGDYTAKGIERVTTIGYLVEDKPDLISVALTKHEGGTYSDVQIIDKRMLVGKPRRIRNAR